MLLTNPRSDLGTCAATVAVVAPATNDNCSIATLINDFNGTADASGVYPLGTTTVTWTVTDVHGNSIQCTQDITVVDDEDPTIICSADQSQTADPGVCDAAVIVIPPVTADNCGIASLVNDFNGTADASDTYPLGSTTIEWTLTDNAGNAVTCNQVITITDDEVPTITCAPDQTQTADAGLCDAAVTVIAPTSADNCGVASVLNDYNGTADASDTYPVGTTTITWTVTDNAGLTATCTQDITITDDELPNAVCMDITVNVDGSGNANIVGADVDGGSTDNCAIASLTVVPNAFTSADLGPNNVVLTVTDVNGNSSTCNAVVTVQDITPPVAVCQDITVNLDATGNISITGTDIDGGSSDNGFIVSWVASPNSFDCSNTGANLVTLTVTDNGGLTDQCTATVTVVDNIAPTMVCQDITVQLDATGNVSIVPADVDNGSSDNCSVALSLDVSAFTCADLGANTVTLTGTDPSGNSSTCTATVTVEDNISPTITCAPDQSQGVDLGTCAATVAVVAPTTNDNCSIATLINDFNGTADASDVYPLGTTTVTWTATDIDGNSIQCTQDITVVDDEDPTIICSADQSQTADPGVCDAAVIVVPPVTADNCGIASLVNDFNGTADASDTYPLGSTTIEWTLTDNAGNAVTCNQVITITDDEVPTITCAPDQTQTADAGLCEAAVTVIAPSSADNCGVASVLNDYNGTADASDNYPVGTTTITWTVTDNAGLTATCTQDITITDDELPNAVCMDITIGLDVSGNASIVGSDIDGGSTDNCAVASLIALPNAFTSADLGPNNVTLTVTDVNGNSQYMYCSCYCC